MFDAINIANQMGVQSPPSQENTARYMLGRSLNFTPGQGYSYSNYGYMLLGLIIEDVTNTDYVSYVKTNILTPSGASNADVILSRTLDGNQSSREPFYKSIGTAYNVYSPGQVVSWPYGGFNVEAMEAHGGLTTSTRAMASFTDNYWLGTGNTRNSNSQNWIFFGSLPGTFTMAYQRPDGYNVITYFNARTGNINTDGNIRFLIQDASIIP